MIGPAATFIALLMVGLITKATISAGVLPALLFAGVAFLEGHFVTPTIIGRRLELNALAETALQEVTGLMEYLQSPEALRNAR